ncbi:MAG: thioredoxin family protein [bacterium]
MYIIRFTATWCADCIVMRSVWNKWLTAIPLVKIIDYDFDDNDDLAREYKVKTLPLVMIFDQDNKLVARLEGMQDLDTLKALTNESKSYEIK